MGRKKHYEQFGKDLNVHHMKPRKSFKLENGELDYKRANDLDNLVTLCVRHHVQVEKNIVQVQ